MKNKKLKIIILFVGILIIASFFRFYKLQELPAGLFPDQAANGLDALRILDGYHTPFFEKGNGREALFFYLQAISIKCFGVGVFPLFLVSAIVGTLTILLTFFLVKTIFGPRAAFIASSLLATSYWHTTLSRTGFRAIQTPLFIAGFFLFFVLTIKEKNKIKSFVYAALAGIFLGGGFYTYTSFRAIIGVLGIMLLAIFFSNLRKSSGKFEWFKNLWLQGIIAIIFALLTLSPLIYYFYQHPDHIFFRSGHVSIFNPDLNNGDALGTFLDVLKKTALSFFTAGDLNWRHNVSGFAHLNSLVAALFGIGLLIIIIRFIKAKIYFFFNRDKFIKFLNLKDFSSFIILLTFILMLAPEVMTAEGIPHGLRLIGVIPAVFIIAALGAEFILQRIRPLANKKLFLGLFILVGAVLLIESALYDYVLYFKVSANSPEFYYAYRADLTAVSNYLNERNNKDQTYLVLDEYSVQTPEYLTSKTGNPYILFNPATSYLIPLKKGDQVVFTQSTIFDTKKFKECHLQANLIKEEKNKWGEVIMRVYEY